MSLVNFKGIRDLSVQFGPETTIYGANASGKTTIADAFTWLLFGKDSSDRKDFNIKTLDSAGNPVPKTEASVEARLQINGLETVLRRVYREKWTKRRGSAEEVFDGNETLNFWDDVPLAQKDYAERIAGILDEDTFKLITNPLYFNSLNWKKKREVLLKMAGNISDGEILEGITSKLSLKALSVILNSSKTLDDWKKELSAKKRKLNDEVKLIPARIDEAERGKPAPVDVEALLVAKTVKEAAIASIDEQINNAGAAYRTKFDAEKKVRDQIGELRKQVTAEQWSIADGVRGARMEIDAEVAKMNSDRGVLVQELNGLWRQVKEHESTVSKLEVEVTGLREQWHAVNNETLAFSEDEFCCPTCNTPFPEEKAEEKKTELRQNFNQSKSERMDAIKAKGGEKSALITTIKSQIETLKEAEALSKAKREELDEKISALKDKADSLRSNEDAELGKAYLASQTLSDIYGRIAELEASIEQIEEPDTATLKEQKSSLALELKEIERQLATVDLLAKADARIDELKRQERTMSAEIAELEGSEMAIDQFNKAKVELIEQRVSSLFEFTAFRMFEAQINGGETETCVAMYGGVPYSDLNTAGRILVGIDIINALNNFYGVTAPIFLDNRESVTWIPATQGQVINLVVSEEDKALRVASASAEPALAN